MFITISYEDKTIQNNFEYVVLILISIFGLFLLCSSNDLITAYLAIELQSVAFYLMAAFKKNSTYSIESGLKYFVIGSLSSAFFLFGSAIIYGCLGSLSFDDIRMFLSLHSQHCDNIYELYDYSAIPCNLDSQKIWSSLTLTDKLEMNYNIQILNTIFDSYYLGLSHGLPSNLPSSLNLDFIYLGFIFLCISIFIKLALAPFHFWSLDVYEGAPNTTTVFFAVVPKIGLFILLIRICYSSFYSSFFFDWQPYFLLIAVFSIFIGSVGGLEQRKLNFTCI
jgi:NADH:ubiquinone oxidoreductase subunit 2 (subunit N)